MTDREKLDEALKVLRMHHQWHQDQTTPLPDCLVLANAYEDSTLCEKTTDALRLAKPLPQWLRWFSWEAAAGGFIGGLATSLWWVL